MKTSTGAPTKADRERFDYMRRIGCIPCGMRGLGSQNDVQHLKSGNKRRGHQATVPWCPWHHRGVPPDNWTVKQAEAYYGPSFALNPRAFRAEFGTDDEQLARTNELIEKHRRSTSAASAKLSPRCDPVSVEQARRTPDELTDEECVRIGLGLLSGKP